MNYVYGTDLDKLPNDTQIWLLLNKDYHNSYLRINDTGDWNSDELIAFIEKEDAEEMLRIIRNLGLFSTVNIGIGSERLEELRKGANIYEQVLTILNHAQALELFKTYSKQH